MMTEEKPAYQVLANKYRPSQFDDLIGQEALVRTLCNAIANNRIANAFLLTGIRGVGKTTTARIIAKALNCTNIEHKGQGTISPCGKCEQCLAIKADHHPDVLEIDAASRTGVDDMREIIDNVNYLPSMGSYKIYIIDEVHMLSKNAFNALLKTLEEPPSHVKFIFATTEIRKIPITVLSRCQRFDLKRIDTDRLAEHLANIANKENASIDERSLTLLSHCAEGSVRDALSLLDQAISYGNGTITEDIVQHMLGLADKDRLLQLFQHLTTGNANEALSLFDALYKDGINPIQLIQELLELTHQLTKQKTLNITDPTLPSHLHEALEELAKSTQLGFLTCCWQMFMKGLQELQFAPDVFSATEMLLIRILHMSTLPTPFEMTTSKKQNSSPNRPSHNTHSSTTTAPTSKPTATIEAPKVQAPTPQPQTSQDITNREAATPAQNGPTSFEDVVELFKDNGEILLHTWLSNDVALTHFEDGKIEFTASRTLPSDFSKRVSERLKEWTNNSWNIINGKEGGGQTLNQKKEQEKQDFHSELAAKPGVKDVLEAFPGASIQHTEKIGEAS